MATRAHILLLAEQLREMREVVMNASFKRCYEYLIDQSAKDIEQLQLALNFATLGAGNWTLESACIQYEMILQNLNDLLEIEPCMAWHDHILALCVSANLNHMDTLPRYRPRSDTSQFDGSALHRGDDVWEIAGVVYRPVVVSASPQRRTMIMSESSEHAPAFIIDIFPNIVNIVRLAMP